MKNCIPEEFVVGDSNLVQILFENGICILKFKDMNEFFALNISFSGVRYFFMQTYLVQNVVDKIIFFNKIDIFENLNFKYLQSRFNIDHKDLSGQSNMLIVPVSGAGSDLIISYDHMEIGTYILS